MPPDKMPIMSQKSLDSVVDSFTNDINHATAEKIKFTIVDNDKTRTEPKIKPFVPRKRIRILRHITKVEPKTNEEFEVVIKLPNGKLVKMKPVDETPKVETKCLLRNTITNNTKGFLRNTIIKKTEVKPTSPTANVFQVPGGTLIPVTLVDQTGEPISSENLSKIPITKVNQIATDNLTKLPVITKTSRKTIHNPKNVPKILNIGSIEVPVPQLTPISNQIDIISKFVKISPNVPHHQPIVSATVGHGPTPNIVHNISKSSTPFSTVHISPPYQVDEAGKKKDLVFINADAVNKEINDRNEQDNDCVIEEVSNNPEVGKRTRFELESRCAASKRYRYVVDVLFFLDYDVLYWSKVSPPISTKRSFMSCWRIDLDVIFD